MEEHINAVQKYQWVDKKAIGLANFKIVIDVINSTGAIAIPLLLKALGVEDIIILNEEINGKFAHNPEPLPENLTQLSQEVIKHNASWVLR